MKPIESSAVPTRMFPEHTPLWLRRFTKLVAFSTLFLIFAGAMVTSTGSGLAVPDWPLSYGRLMPPMVGGIIYEHGHRMIAATVGFLTIIQAIWLQRREPKRFVRMLGWCSLGAVIVQGLLGGLTVLFLLPTAISVAHAGLAEIFFCLNVSIAFFTSDFFQQLRTVEKGNAPVGLTMSLTGIVYLQILAGALMRHLGAGLAIPDWPLSFGRLIPEFATKEIAANFIHRTGGIVVFAFVVALAVRMLRYASNHPLRMLVHILLTIVGAQVMLGGYVIWSGKQPHLTSLHVMTGALTLAMSLIVTLATRTVAWKRAAASSASPLIEVTA
jgi:cytochrome c oxidase assembly protein subunit 15